MNFSLIFSPPINACSTQGYRFVLTDSYKHKYTTTYPTQINFPKLYHSKADLRFNHFPFLKNAGIYPYYKMERSGYLRFKYYKCHSIIYSCTKRRSIQNLKSTLFQTRLTIRFWTRIWDVSHWYSDWNSWFNSFQLKNASSLEGEFESNPMGKRGDILDSLNVEKKKYEVRLVERPKSIRNSLYFSTIVTILILYHRDAMSLDWRILSCIAIIPVINFIRLKAEKRRTEKELKRIQEEERDAVSKVVNDEDINSCIEFLKKLQTQSRTDEAEIDAKRISIACSLWDKIAKTYRHNKEAIICPNCGANNGLSLHPDETICICPNCKHFIKQEISHPHAD